VDGPGLGWTVNMTYAWRGDNASDMLCTQPSYTTDYWGNPFNGTILLVRRGACAFGVKATYAMVYLSLSIFFVFSTIRLRLIACLIGRFMELWVVSNWAPLVSL
jgi:hypothetical protein